MKRTVSASLSTMMSLPACARYPSGGTPPIHIPFRFEAAILSRMRSPMTSRSNCANDNSTLRVKRPIEVVVLNCCVTDTKEAPLVSRTSTILAKSASERALTGRGPCAEAKLATVSEVELAELLRNAGDKGSTQGIDTQIRLAATIYARMRSQTHGKY